MRKITSDMQVYFMGIGSLICIVQYILSSKKIAILPPFADLLIFFWEWLWLSQDAGSRYPA
jgi:hypothetical protein